MAERSVGRRARRRRSIEPGRILALGRIVNGFGADADLASHGRTITRTCRTHTTDIATDARKGRLDITMLCQ